MARAGYRALSRRAAAEASIIHEYNYAQVLTIDLMAKGFGYAEVPITYRFRSGGRSFVHLPTYLHRVVPAVARQLVASRSVLHDVFGEGRTRRSPGGAVDASVRAEAGRNGMAHGQGVMSVVMGKRHLAADGDHSREAGDAQASRAPSAASKPRR